MTTLRSIPAPPEVHELTGVTGGFWFRFDDADAYALIWWQGGPKSPDKDIILHWIEATPQRAGHGTELLKEICGWCDRYGLSLSCLVDPALTDWLGRLGFLRIEARYESVVMGRSPRRVSGGLLVP